MLSTNKPSMDNKLTKLYDVFEDAAYNAYYEASKPEMPKIDPKEDELGSLQKQSTDAFNATDKKIKDNAKVFAIEFVNQLKDGKVLETISDEIDKHVKSIKLSISIPSLLPTIISPMGPCSGALTISEETGARINLL